MFDLSYTKTKTYLNCPWLYKLKFIEELKAPPSPEAALGSSIHRALEGFHKEGKKTLDELYEALDSVWQRVGFRNVEEEFSFYDKARMILKTYFDEIASKWEGSVKEVEKKFFLDLPSIGLRLQGILDRVDTMPDGVSALIEYKSQGDAWSLERLAQDLQMTLYSKAVEGALGVSRVRLYFFFLSQGKWLEVKRDSHDWVAAEKILVDVKQGVESSQFKPDTNYCPFCDMNKTCKYSIVR